MHKFNFSQSHNNPDFIQSFLYMSYLALVVSSILLFNEIITIKVSTYHMIITGSLVPYVFLYPISFIVLRVYGPKSVNNMIWSMILGSLLFVVMSNIVVELAGSSASTAYPILNSSFKMYLAGLIGMPAGIYAGFVGLYLLMKVGFKFSASSIFIATIFGELVNTIIVFPIGFHGRYTLEQLFKNVIIDGLIFKVIMGAILSCMAIFIVNIIVKRKYDGTI